MLVTNHGGGRTPSILIDKPNCQPVPGADSSNLPAECAEEKSAFQQKDIFSPASNSEPRVLPFLDLWTQRISQTGAMLGLATLACRYIGPLRVLGNMSIALLSSTPVAATLLGSGAYLTARHAPHAKEALGRWITGDYRKTDHSILDDGLFLGSYGIGLLGIGVGFGSFGLGARTFFRTRREFLSQNYTPKRATLSAYIVGDTVRRAVMDPEEWIQLGGAAFQGWQRNALVNGGWWANRILIGGSALFGVGHFTVGGASLFEKRRQSGEWEFGTLFNLWAQLALDVAPGVTTALYRAGRGDYGQNIGPGVSQKYTERVYSDPNLREVVYYRIHESVPPLSNKVEYKFLNDARMDLEKVSLSLDRAETLPPLQYRLQNGTAFPSFARTEDPIILKPKPTNYFKGARDPINEKTAKFLSEATLPEWAQFYSSGEISPVGVLRYIQKDPIVKNSAIFPRDITRGPLARLLLERAMESEQRFRNGTARPLEGVLMPVKDTFPGLDGIMMVGSKTTRIRGVKDSPVVKSLLDAGAIPVPVGMVAAANGGSGMNAGFGYIPHPHRRKFDPGGSSSATSHTIGRKKFPMTVGIGTDTGGSITAPAGAVGLVGFVPPRQFLSTDNMVPFDTSLDRVGVLALHPQDALFLVRLLSRPLNGHAVKALQPSTEQPRVVYVQKVLDQASDKSKAHFLGQMEKYKESGYEVQALGKDWDFLVETPLLLYPIDAYGAAAFTHTNPLQKNLWEPPRRSLDRNLWARLPRGEISLRYGLFDQARELTQRYQELVRSKLGPQTVLVSPSTEAIPKLELEQGRAGSLLDQHDRITMAKNRMPEWAQISVPARKRSSVGIVYSGVLENLVQFLPKTKTPDLSEPPPPPTPPRSWGAFPKFVPSATHGTEAT